MISHEWRRRAWSWWQDRSALVTLLLLVAAVAASLHHRGITWGDDYALYLRQARSLLDGNVGQVIADNHFNVTNAAKPGFSPYVYPWGFPLLLAPFVRIFGMDYAKFKLLEVACLVGFLWCFHAVIRRRMPRWNALAVVAVIGSSLAYLRHTEFLVSEYPYMFAVAATLWWLDHLRLPSLVLRYSSLDDDDDNRTTPLDLASTRQLVVLGLMAMLVFNIRREGLAIVAAIAVAQLFDLRGRWRTADRRRVVTPYVAFVGGVIGLQLLLPSALAPEYDGSGLGQTWEKLQGPFRTAFADQLGFPGIHGTRLLLLFLLAVAGVLVRMFRAPGRDAPLLVFAVVSMSIVGMIPAVADRYLLGVTPFAVYFGAQAIAAVPLPRRLGRWLAVAALAAASAWHVSDLPSALRDVQRFNDSGAALDGPLQPYAQAAFSAVRTYTHQDDVVAFFKARSLTFFTDRRAVQSSDLEVVRQRADYFMMRRNSSFSQPVVDEQSAESMGWTPVWEDADWVLWRLPLYERG